MQEHLVTRGSTGSTQSAPTMTSFHHATPGPVDQAPSHGVETDASPSTETTSPASALRRVVDRLRFSRKPTKHALKRSYPQLPRPSQERLDASLSDHAIDVAGFETEREKEKTVLYLAYGSNLCKETFRGVRGIKPLSQINVVVPDLRLTFDLPGVPYNEPCFANCAVRNLSQPAQDPPQPSEYHKDRWHKGLVGCVYEVTLPDFAHIIATEGGGASYKDVLTDCYALPDSDSVPMTPSSKPFKAHTLFSPQVHSPPSSQSLFTRSDRMSRPDPSYAQPSARYLKLLTDGAAELSLPEEYRDYLGQIRPYTITTRRQLVGQKLFSAVWMPFFFLVFALQKLFQDDKGRSPKWLAAIMGAFWVSMWVSYDGAFKKVFGDGERTEGQGEDLTIQGLAKEWVDADGEAPEKRSLLVQ